MMTDELGSSAYVLDTHSLYWYWSEPGRLGSRALAAFGAIAGREAVGLVPLVVVAELHYLTARQRSTRTVEEILHHIDSAPGLRLEAMTRRHLIAFGRLKGISEMHDRFIGAVAVLYDVPLVTRDPVFHSHPQVRAVW